MIPLTDLIAGLRRNLALLPFALDREVRLGMEEAATTAKNFIGAPQPGWADLAASTIAEKTALGYPTPAPLLREGDLRDSIEGVAESFGREVAGRVGSDDPVALYQEMERWVVISPLPLSPSPARQRRSPKSRSQR